LFEETKNGTVQRLEEKHMAEWESLEHLEHKIKKMTPSNL